MGVSRHECHTCGGGSSSSPIKANKIVTADQSFSEIDSFTDITGLTVELEASTKYTFIFMFARRFDDIGTWKFVIPTGATGRFDSTEAITTFDLSDEVTVTNSPSPRSNSYVGSIITTNAGTFKIQAKQDVSAVDTMDVLIGSMFMVTEEV